MAYALIFLSVVALAAALALLFSDSRERTAAPAQLDDAPPAPKVTEPEPEAHAEATVEAAPEQEPEPEPEPEPGPAPEPVPETEPEPVTLRRWVAPTEADNHRGDGEDSAGGEDGQPRSEQPRPHRRSGLQLPGASRRERRAWAERHDFGFSRQDEFLNGEWSRGAAASGAAAKDIASGAMYGHDTFVMDLGGVTVMAMRTGEVSDVVVDLRRVGFSADSSADLVEVGQIGGFTVHATEAGPAQRFVDVRVRTAVEQLPACVTAVWFESEWVLAETARASGPEEWDAMFAPLALLADAARALPPHAWHKVTAPYPTREMGEAREFGGDVVKREEAAPKVQRPEEPLELPTRTTGEVRGVMDHRAVGGDEVEAIADGSPREPRRSDLTRVRRDQRPPSIFGD